MRHINDAGLALIERNEGLRVAAYRDIAGIWTIGYGHTGSDVHAGLVITAERATELLRQDVGHAEAAVDAATHDVPTTDNQFSAMVSLAFNIGVAAFRKSSVLRIHRAGNYATAADAFLLWDKAHVNGTLVTVHGLLRRRGEERALYLQAAPAQPTKPVPRLVPRMAPPEPIPVPPPVIPPVPVPVPPPLSWWQRVIQQVLGR